MAEVAKLVIDGKTYELPIVIGTEGERAIDISKLRATAGCITLDTGYANTGCCISSITFIDGDKGILRYRGYPIEELAEKSTFLETAYLLLHGELPTKAQLEKFSDLITHHTMVHEDIIRNLFRGFPKSAHPMAVTASVVGALSTFYQDSLDPMDPEQVGISMIRLIAKVSTIAAYAYKYSIGQPFNYPQNRLTYPENILHMMFATPAERYDVHPVLARAVDVLLILHADHEQNCSTSTMRMVGSSQANIYASVSAAINALWGPLHGGANQAVIEMLQGISDNEGSARGFLDRCKDQNDTTRLMGFGHRVYKNFDPRARILKEMTRSVLDAVGRSTRLLDIAVELEEMALHDEYFVKRKLYPNVDFYSGIIYQTLGIPVNMFTVFFALGRLPGWVSHWIEQNMDSNTKIGRPRQVYMGSRERRYAPIQARG
jgi:citrate synthase